LNKIIINENCSVLRAISRNELKGNWLTVTLCVYLYYLLLTVIPQVFNEFVSLGSITQYSEFARQNVTFSYIAYFYIMFFTGVFSVGICSFMIAFFRNKDINPGYLFNGFEYYLKCFALSIVIGLFTFLWTLAFIVPGIIAAIRYSQAYFILADDPDKGIMQCINESKYMMNGNKAKYFVLQLTFIGWLFLSAIPVSVFSNRNIIANDIVSFLLSTLTAVILCIVIAYIKTTQTVFYDMLTEHLKAKPAFSENDYHFVSSITDDSETGSEDNSGRQN